MGNGEMCLAVWRTREAPPRSAGPKFGGVAAAAGPGCSLAWTGRRWFLARERFGLVWLGNAKFWLSSPPAVISLRLAGEEGEGGGQTTRSPRPAAATAAEGGAGARDMAVSMFSHRMSALGAPSHSLAGLCLLHMPLSTCQVSLSLDVPCRSLCELPPPVSRLESSIDAAR